MSESTLFQRKAEEYQKSQERTKEQALKISLAGFAACLLVGAAIAAVLVFVTRKVPCILLVALVGCVIGAVVGGIQTLVSFLRPTKVVICPTCGTEHRLYQSVRKYMCTCCRSLLLFGTDPTLQPALKECSFCKRQIAVSPDHGRFLCPNCGSMRQANAYGFQPEVVECSKCGASVPKSALYCVPCGAILKSDLDQPVVGDTLLKYDYDWKTGKDATGHLHYVRVLLKHVANKAQGKVDLKAAQALITRIEEALLSLGEAWQEPKLRPRIAEIVPQLDNTYAAVLDCELACLRELKKGATLSKEELVVISSEPHIAARREVERIMDAVLTSSGGIGKWTGELVKVRTAGATSVIRDYEDLENEAARFQKWKSDQRTSLKSDQGQTIKVACTGCSKELDVPISFAGKQGKCPYCYTVLNIPRPEAE